MTDPTPKAVVVPVEPTEAMMSAGMARLIHGGAHLGLKNAFKAMALAAPQASLPPVEGVREGDVHTRLMEVVSAEVFRQHPDSFTEGNDFDLVIPSGVAPATAFVKIDVSSIAEVVLPYVRPAALYADLLRAVVDAIAYHEGEGGRRSYGLKSSFAPTFQAAVAALHASTGEGR